MSKPKLVALTVLAAIVLVAPIVETLMTGHTQSLSSYDIAGSFISLVPIYWWYHLDKEEHGYRAGRLLNVGVAGIAVIALPVYFIRSRGWKRGAIATAVAIAVFGGLYLVELLGEAIGGLVTGMQ